ncbi:MAG: glucose-6-phosphate dehydrogenase [Nitrososphaeria archaeon]|jgi:glucose-6-phosphate 1-dehydrogenase
MSNEVNKGSRTSLDPHIFVIFGATGNLTRRKLFPVIYNLSAKGTLQKKNIILGVAHKQDQNDQSFRIEGLEVLRNSGLPTDDKLYQEWCNECLYYQSIGKESMEDFEKLAVRIKVLEQERKIPGNRILYMAIPPESFLSTIENLAKVGLNTSEGWTRLVVEKPFGVNLSSAQELNITLHRHFDESQIFRIDHFLGKETVQNLMVFRFGNTLFEELWNREHIESVQITVAEEVGIEGRAKLYEQVGALGDIVQNHLAQILTLVAMENPELYETDAIRYEKLKVLRQIRPINPEDVVFGQYTHGIVEGQEVKGYREETGIPQNSQMNTFACMKLEVANWRWKGVPFYIRAGKRLPRRLTEVMIRFHAPPVSLFRSFESISSIKPNILTIILQPDEGFELQFQVKMVGFPVNLSTQRLHFRYAESFGPLPDAYENLLLEIVRGNQTHFVNSEMVLESWRIFDPLIRMSIPVYPYPAGTWGPSEADELLRRYKETWENRLD